MELPASDEISTLKKNTIEQLQSEEVATKVQIRFQNHSFASRFEEKMHEIYSLIYKLALIYNLQHSTYCLFDKIFRKFVEREFKDFLLTEEVQLSQNVGNHNSTDS
jgi:hypothetical protein